MSGLLLDTHIWIWAQLGDASRVTEAFVHELDRHQVAGTAYVSAISVLELERMVFWGGHDLGSSVETFVESGTSDNGLKILPLDTNVLIESVRLPGEMHKDPSDRLIVATARTHELTLITVDKQILRYAAAGHVIARKP